PSWTMAKATSAWIPTMTVTAPRRSVMWAIVRSERAANESITSSAVTSTMMPLDRYRLTWSIRSSCRERASLSVMADWIEAIRYVPCLRIGTDTSTVRSADLAHLGDRLGAAAHLVAEEPLRLLDAALEVAHGVHLREVDADGHQSEGDLGREAGDDAAGTHEPRGLDGLHEVVCHGRVDGRNTGDIYHHDLGPIRPNSPQQLLGHLASALAVQDTDDRQNEESLPDLQYRRGQLTDRLLLLADDPLTLLDEAHTDRVGDAVGRGLVGVQDAVQQLEVALVLLEQRAGEDVTQQQDDTE